MSQVSAYDPSMDHSRRVPRRPVNSSLTSLVRSNSIETIREHISSGRFPINTLSTCGYSALHIAVKNKKYTIVEMLLGFGIDRTRRCLFDERTALHLACMNGFISIVRLMLSSSTVDLEIVDVHRKTPLSYAIEYHNKPIAKLLIQIGADYSYLPQTTINEIMETSYSRMLRLQREQSQRVRVQRVRSSLQRESLFSGQVSILQHTLVQQQPITTETKVKRPNKDIIDLIIKDAIDKGAICPIGLDEISTSNAALTSCFHLFIKENIEYWLKEKDICPSCKTKCFVF